MFYRLFVGFTQLTFSICPTSGGHSLSLTFDIFDARYESDLLSNPDLVVKYSGELTMFYVLCVLWCVLNVCDLDLFGVQFVALVFLYVFYSLLILTLKHTINIEIH